MELEEIKNYISYQSVCVDISISDKYSGFVRKVTFYANNRVCIEFIGYGIEDEQGYEFCHIFDSIEDAVNVIEKFLGKPIERWINHTKTGAYPESLPNIDITSGLKELLYDIVMREIYLPDNQLFKPKFKLI